MDMPRQKWPTSQRRTSLPGHTSFVILTVQEARPSLRGGFSRLRRRFGGLRPRSDTLRVAFDRLRR